MEYHMLHGIVREAIIIFCKNGKLMPSFTLLTLSLYSILYLFSYFSMKPLITNLICNQGLLLLSSPNSPQYANLLTAVHKDSRIFFGVKLFFLLISSIISFFLSIATILASAITHAAKPLSLKDLLSRTARSLKRPFVSLLYITFFVGCCFFLFLQILLPLMMILHHVLALKALYITLLLLTSAFNAYLAVCWTLALVISILEEDYGIEALGKAKEIVKGMEIHGFLINLLIIVLSFIIFMCFRLITFKKLAGFHVMIGLVIANSIWLVRMFGLIAYTVYYYQCKKRHGEDVQFQGSHEYSKLPFQPVISENVP